MLANDNRLILNHELSTAQNESTRITKSFNELLKELRSHSKDFFFQISIVSAGIISLSVTYIGYLSSKAQFRINYPEFLFIGWFLEIIALIGSLYRNYFYGHFAHWQGQSDLIKAYIKTEKAILNLTKEYPYSIANINTQEEINDYIRGREKQIDIYNENLQFNKRNEAYYQKLWRISEKASIFGFGFGIVLIIVFSSLNLPVQIGYSFITTVLSIIIN